MDGRAAGDTLSDQFLDLRLGGEAAVTEEEDEGRDGAWGGADDLIPMVLGVRG